MFKVLLVFLFLPSVLLSNDLICQSSKDLGGHQTRPDPSEHMTDAVVRGLNEAIAENHRLCQSLQRAEEDLGKEIEQIDVRLAALPFFVRHRESERRGRGSVHEMMKSHSFESIFAAIYLLDTTNSNSFLRKLFLFYAFLSVVLFVWW